MEPSSSPNSNFESQHFESIHNNEQQMHCDIEDVAISLEDIPFSSQIEKKMDSSNMKQCNDANHDKSNDEGPVLDDDEEYLKFLADEMIEEDQENLQKVRDTTLAMMDDPHEELSVDLTSIFTTDQVFDSHEAVTKHLKALAREKGVVIVKKRSNMTRKRTHFIFYQCERSGFPREYEKKVGGTGKNKPRESSTKKCGCPFLLKTLKDNFREVWTVRVLNGVHNHKLFKYEEGHAYLGRIDREQVDFVATMTRNGILPKHILRMLRKDDKNNCTSSKAIYNVRAKIKKKAREGRTVMQEVFKLADKNTSFVECRHDEGNVVKDVFWAFNESLSLARCFPTVMLMDCTYKTNKYKMPLLQIVGVTCTDMTFSIGFALLCLEREENYTWALTMLRKAIGVKSDQTCCIVTDREEALMNALRVVYPKAKNLICRWHIEKGLVANLKTKTTSEVWQDLMTAWTEVVKSESEDELNERLEECKKIFSEDAMSYVSCTWLNAHKEALCLFGLARSPYMDGVVQGYPFCSLVFERYLSTS